MRPQLTSYSPRPFPSSLLLACGFLSGLSGLSALPGCGMSSGVFVAESDAPDDSDSMPAPKPMDGGTTDEGGSNGASGRPNHSRMVSLPCGTGPGCDPSDLGGESCETLGLGKGTLLCNTSTCTYETMLCQGLGELAPCGTGPGCDTSNLGGATCESLGMPTGVLACDPVTCAYDTAGCIAMAGLLAGGLFGATGATDADGGTAVFGAGLFGGTAAGGLFGAGTFGGTPGVPGAAAADEEAP